MSYGTSRATPDLSKAVPDRVLRIHEDTRSSTKLYGFKRLRVLHVVEEGRLILRVQATNANHAYLFERILVADQ